MSSQKNTYEAMFLLDAGGTDFQVVSEPIRAILSRNQAEVLSMKPWEDRRLAYEIQGRRRGLYVLAYLNVEPTSVKEIEHDCQLDERILRVLILRRDKFSETELAAETPADMMARRAAEGPAEGEAPAEERGEDRREERPRFRVAEEVSSEEEESAEEKD